MIQYCLTEYKKVKDKKTRNKEFRFFKKRKGHIKLTIFKKIKKEKIKIPNQTKKRKNSSNN